MNELHRLMGIVKTLRDPSHGCEWDKAQTFESLKPYTLEEVYEVIDAIDSKNHEHLKKELGDLLFHILFYADLADDDNLFNFDDICASISDKLIHRHPHLFSNRTQPKPNWEAIKQVEREQQGNYSLLDDISTAMPALMRAEKIQKRCASVGFDWDDPMLVLDKIQEELDEVRHELTKQTRSKENIEEEIGDLFFATVNLARHLNMHAEICLQKGNAKFERRFKQVEAIIHEQKKKINGTSLADMEAAWQQVKRFEKEESLNDII